MGFFYTLFVISISIRVTSNRVSTLDARDSLSTIGSSYPRSHNFYDIYRDSANNEIQITDCSFFDYDGHVNKTKDGFPCKKWKDVRGVDVR